MAVCLNMRVIRPITWTKSDSVESKFEALINFSHSSKLAFNSYRGGNNNIERQKCERAKQLLFL